jgi:hypothetical protein
MLAESIHSPMRKSFGNLLWLQTPDRNNQNTILSAIGTGSRTDQNHQEGWLGHFCRVNFSC